MCGRECLPATQLVQVDELDAPVIDEYLPATQLVQFDELDAPVLDEYLPERIAVSEANK